MNCLETLGNLIDSMRCCRRCDAQMDMELCVALCGSYNGYQSYSSICQHDDGITHVVCVRCMQLRVVNSFIRTHGMQSDSRKANILIVE